jgi:hypothetical protein
MAAAIFFLTFFLFLGSDSFAQSYKYVDKNGAICFSDRPPASLVKVEDQVREEKVPKTALMQENRKKVEIKDILQIGQEILDEELAKPPGKQNRSLILEMTEILYGKISPKKPK